MEARRERLSMDLDANTKAVKTAAAPFELVNAEGAQSEEEFARVYGDAVAAILHQNPDMGTELIAFAADLALGRYHARRECGCVAGTKPNENEDLTGLELRERLRRIRVSTIVADARTFEATRFE